MAITKTISNRFKLELGKATINFTSDVFKAIIMADGFTFNPDTHGTLAAVVASVITSAGGYTEKTLAVDTAWNQDNTNDIAFVDWENVTWTASGGNFDDFIGVIVYDDSHADDVVVGCIDLGQIISVIDGNSFQLQNIGFELAMVV
jgi:hypothetical protein